MKWHGIFFFESECSLRHKGFSGRSLDMLDNVFIPQIDEDDHEHRIHVQQDGAALHYLITVRGLPQ